MQSYQLKYDLEYAPSNTLRIKSGSALHVFSTMPGSVGKYGDMSNVVPYRMERRKMLVQLCMEKFNGVSGLIFS